MVWSIGSMFSRRNDIICGWQITSTWKFCNFHNRIHVLRWNKASIVVLLWGYIQQHIFRHKYISIVRREMLWMKQLLWIMNKTKVQQQREKKEMNWTHRHLHKKANISRENCCGMGGSFYKCIEFKINRNKFEWQNVNAKPCKTAIVSISVMCWGLESIFNCHPQTKDKSNDIIWHANAFDSAQTYHSGWRWFHCSRIFEECNKNE